VLWEKYKSRGENANEKKTKRKQSKQRKLDKETTEKGRKRAKNLIKLISKSFPPPCGK